MLDSVDVPNIWMAMRMMECGFISNIPLQEQCSNGRFLTSWRLLQTEFGNNGNCTFNDIKFSSTLKTSRAGKVPVGFRQVPVQFPARFRWVLLAARRVVWDGLKNSFQEDLNQELILPQ